MKLVRPIEGGNKFAIWCPACQCAHVFVVPPWKLIGTPECPTVVGFEQGTAG